MRLKIATLRPLTPAFLYFLLILVACSESNPTVAPAALEQSAPVMPFPAEGQKWQILPESSEARFMIDEILRGEPKTVIGSTRQVSGELGIDLTDLSSTSVGPIEIQAASIVTDNNFRNRAIHERILLSRVYEQITFRPQQIVGLPPVLTPGETADFTLEGQLTITDVTQPAAFEVSVHLSSPSTLRGQARATIKRDDFKLVVPSAPAVAAVSDEVVLELDFVAAVEE